MPTVKWKSPSAWIGLGVGILAVIQHSGIVPPVFVPLVSVASQILGVIGTALFGAAVTLPTNEGEGK
jgi:uncharacterized membrane protein